MHLNFNLGIRLNGHSTPQKVQPLCECLGSIPRFVCINLYCILFLFASNLFTIVYIKIKVEDIVTSLSCGMSNNVFYLTPNILGGT